MASHRDDPDAPTIAVLKALAHPMRLAILREVRAAPPVGARFAALMRRLRLADSTLSGHLVLLERAGLVRRRKLADRTVAAELAGNGIARVAKLVEGLRPAIRPPRR